MENKSSGTKKTISQKTIYEGIGSAIMFNSTNKITELINDTSTQRIGDIANCVTGFYSGSDKDYLHPLNKEVKNAKKYSCVEEHNIHISPLTDNEKEHGILSNDCYVPIVKGGNIEYVKPNHWFMNWSAQAICEYRVSKKCRFQNSSFYFKNGIGIPMIRSSKLTGALIENRLFDQSIVGVFPKDESFVNYLLGFINSSICTELINAINPSTNNSANYIKKIPFITPSDEIKEKVDSLVRNIIENLKKGNSDIEDIKQQLDTIFYNLYFNGIGINVSKSKRLSISAKQLSILDIFN